MTPLRPAVLACLWIAAIVAAGYHLYVEARAVGLAEPMGMWETNYVALARTWPHQYQAGHFVDGFDPYGPGYPAFVRPFLRVLRDPYAAHRVANLAALAVACGLLGLVLRANRCPAGAAAGLVALYYALQAGSYSIQARPDFLVAGEIIALLALGQPAVRARFHPAVFAVVFGSAALAAYLTKPYTLLAGAIVVVHGLWFGPRRPALWTAILGGAILAGGVAAFARANPYYLFEAFLSHLAKPENDGAWFLQQWRDFALLAFAGVALGAIPVAREVRHFCAHLPRTLVHPQPAEAATGYWSLAAAAGFGALLGPPGWRIGAYLTYHFHLLLPPLLVLAGLAWRPAAGAATAVRLPGKELVLAANLALVLFLAPAPPPPDPGWTALADDIRRQPGPLVLDFILAPLAEGRGDVTLLGSGITAVALAEPGYMQDPGPLTLQARAEVAAFEARVKHDAFGGAPPPAIYLEVGWVATPRGPQPVPRGGLAYLLADHLAEYRVARVFRIHPYYFSTNAPRQQAGTWGSDILKLVRPPPSPSPSPGGTSPHRD
ncbi:MAG TPA: hypothetical protein VHD61_03890 [Lacunisphaera sp.]|nr:hypothetical protein [Lacunisphaera sp.]